MIWTAAASALAGAALSVFPALLPGLHIYSVLGPLALILYNLPGGAESMRPEVILPFTAGAVTAWSMLNTVPSVLLGAPDESALFTVLPGQKYLMNGRGFEGTLIIGAGGLTGLILLTASAAAAAPAVMPVVRYVLAPHTHWILWCIITFMLISEWPKGGDRGPSRLFRFMDAWSTLAAGLLTFFLSGLFGFLLLTRSPVSVENAFQNIMPAFTGLFAVPWCLLNGLSRSPVPPQEVRNTLPLNGALLARGALAGCFGGGLAAFLPAVTGGVGGMLAGHTFAQRDERIFMISQGASKTVYYAGALLLSCLPGLRITRGGAAWMLRGIYTPLTKGDYYLALGSVALSGAAAFLLLAPAARAMLYLIRKINYRLLSVLSLLIMVLLVGGLTGIPGLFITAVGTGIGLLPVVFGSRRLNCLGILLLPIACNLSGFGERVAAILA